MPSSVMGILKLAEEVLFKESAFIAVDQCCAGRRPEVTVTDRKS